MAQISLRVDDEVKKNAEKTFDAIGLNMSTAINIFLKAVVRENRIPFELSADPFYSETNIERLRESIRKVETGEDLCEKFGVRKHGKIIYIGKLRIII